MSEEAIEEVKKRKAWQGWEEPPRDGGEQKGQAEVRGPLLEKQRAVLAYTDAMTVSVNVPDEIFGWLKRLFSDREVVEITSTVAAYNCVSRFLVALDIGEMNKKDDP